MLRANKEAWRIYHSVLLKHYKRGNWHHIPNFTVAWRSAVAARWICRGCPIGKEPRYLRRKNVPLSS